MLKMSGFEGLFAAAGNLYLLLALAAICFALWIGKTWTRKLGYAVLVLALFIAPIAPEIYRTIEYRAKLAKAQALFDERCKTAGEKIYRTVEGVNGVFLITIKRDSSKSAQFELNEQAGDSAHDVGYVQTYFMGKQNEFVLTDQSKLGSYQFVETKDDVAKAFNRYTDTRDAQANESFTKIPLTKEVTTEIKAKYGVLTEDISTAEDRQSWIAGSRIKVIDLESKNVLAERTGYIFDKALGDTRGERSPWAFAAYNACPALPKLHGQYPHQWGLTRNFVDKTLKPTQGK